MEVPNRINGESERGMVEKLYSRFGGVLNGGVKLRSSPTNLAGTLLLTLPPSKFGLLLVKFMLICPPNEVLNRLTFEERMAKDPPPQSWTWNFLLKIDNVSTWKKKTN